MSKRELSKLLSAKYQADCKICLGIGCIHCRIEEEQDEPCDSINTTVDGRVLCGLHSAEQRSGDKEERVA